MLINCDVYDRRYQVSIASLSVFIWLSVIVEGAALGLAESDRNTARENIEEQFISSGYPYHIVNLEQVVR